MNTHFKTMTEFERMTEDLDHYLPETGGAWYFYAPWSADEQVPEKLPSRIDFGSLRSPKQISPKAQDEHMRSGLVIFVPNQLCYRSTTLDWSNIEVAREELKPVPGVVKVFGEYGYEAIGFTPEALQDERVQDIFDALASYPILDEDHLTQLEMELEEEAIRKAYVDDLWSLLKNELFEDERFHQNGKFLLDTFSEEDRQEAFRMIQRKTGTDAIFESPGWPYIDIDRMAARMEPEWLLQMAAQMEPK